MDQPEPSLGGSLSLLSESTHSSSDVNTRRKRKQAWDSIDLQLNDPLSLDLEQILDLQSGRMYYLNRKTLKKSWIRPQEQQNLDLDLNISYLMPSSEKKENSSSSSPDQEPKIKNTTTSTVANAGNMVAAQCTNCHLLVMLCKSSPSCPNCKYNSLPAAAEPATNSDKLETVKSLKTLSLLH